MSEEKFGGESLNVFKASFDRGYKQGYQHGAEAEKNAENWHVPEVTPKHGEMVQVLIQPYNRRTIRMCRKRKINWIQTNGVFLAGEEMRRDLTDAGDDLEEDEVPDMLLVSKHQAVEWGAVLLWMSAEVPEWFLEEYKGEGDL